MIDLSLFRVFSRAFVSPSGCWLYAAGKTEDGYGIISIGNRSVGTHRVAFELVNGPIPDGMCILHSCDTPACINPSHLFIGTKGSNNADRKAKGRNANRRGEQNTMATLTPDQVEEIKGLYASGRFTQKQIGILHGITQQHVSALIRNIFWKHLSEGR